MAKSRDPRSPGAEDRRGRLTVFFTNWGEEPKSHPASVGLKNEIGIVCYRNVSLVVLLHLPIFLNWLDAHSESACLRSMQGNDCLACELAVLSRLYWLSDDKSPEITAIVSRVWSMCTNTFWSTYDLKEQQDCPEFLTGLLQQLQVGPEGEITGNQDLDQAQNINHMFRSIVKNRDCCQSCGLVKFRGRDIYSFIGATMTPEGGPEDVEKCIESYLGGGQELSGMMCDNCGKETTWDRRTVIRDAPEVLFVQVHRTRRPTDGAHSPVQIIKFRETLDMTTHLESYAKQEKGESLHYQLNAVVQHQGAHSRSGHYICYAKGPTGKWSCLNDERCVPATLDSTSQPYGRGWGGYVLVYTRQPLTTPPPKDDPADRSVVRVDDSVMTVSGTTGLGGSQSGPPPSTPQRGDDTDILYELGGSEERRDKSLNASFLFGPEAHRSEEGEQKGMVTRWEGQQAKIDIQITLSEMLLTAKLLGVLRKSKDKKYTPPLPPPPPPPPVTAAAKPTGVTKTKTGRQSKSTTTTTTTSKRKSKK